MKGSPVRVRASAFAANLHRGLLGSRIAFRTGVGGDAQSIVIVMTDGREVHTIKTNTVAPLHTSEPVWSPDSRRLAYVGADATGTHLCLVEADGTGARQLTFDPGDTWPH
jgi:hypothetical protein